MSPAARLSRIPAATSAEARAALRSEEGDAGMNRWLLSDLEWRGGQHRVPHEHDPAAGRRDIGEVPRELVDGEGELLQLHGDARHVLVRGVVVRAPERSLFRVVTALLGSPG